MKKIILLLCVSICFSAFAQSNLDAYKYVIVPNKYGFLKEANQYQLNGLTQFLLEKEGFTALMEDDVMPADLMANGCLALRVDVNSDSSLFKTKLKVLLKDCKNKVVFESPEGVSKEKEYDKAYQGALRTAFESLNDINYKYNGATNIGIAAPAVVAAAPTSIPTPQAVEAEAVTAVAATSNVVSETVTPVTNVLYAQAIPNGYQLVDSSPKVVYKLKKTNMEGVFFVEGKQAIVHQSSDHWVIEFYEGDTLKEEILNVKF